MTSPNVLAAVDFGDPALEALRQARALAHGVTGTLAAVHVLPPLAAFPLVFPERSLTPDADADADAQRVRAGIEEYARSHLGLELGTVFVERGAPYAEIVRRAQKSNASFIVIGTHSRSGLARVVLGSVAERVVRHAHCSVLVARPIRRPGVVLAATDLSPASLPAVAAGAAAARRSGAKLVVTTVIELPALEAVQWAGLFGAVPIVPSPEMRAELRAGAERVLEQTLAGAGATAEVRIVEGSAATEIVRLAEELDAELLVVGTHGRTGLPRLALGSVAERVVQSAGCSVLTVRAQSS